MAKKFLGRYNFQDIYVDEEDTTLIRFAEGLTAENARLKERLRTTSAIAYPQMAGRAKRKPLSGRTLYTVNRKADAPLWTELSWRTKLLGHVLAIKERFGNA